MSTVTVESAATEPKGEETEEVLTPSTDEQEPSSEIVEPEETTEEPPEPVKAEETFEKKVDRMAQSKADKSLVPLQQRNERLTTENEKLTAQLNEKILNFTSNDIYGEELESLGEEDASKRKAARETRNKLILEYQKNAAYVQKTKPLLEAKEANLNIHERNQLVREKLWPLFFPEEKKNLSAYNEAFKKFEPAKDPDDVELILEGIRESLKGKQFVPDSSIQGGGGQIDLSKLSTEDRLARALGKMDKKK